MYRSDPQAIWRATLAPAMLLLLGLVLTSQVNGMVHSLLLDVPGDGAGLVHLPDYVRAQHAAEAWTGTPCVCDAQPTPTPPHVEPLTPAVALLVALIGIAAVVTRATRARWSLLMPRSGTIAPATPPPQA